MTSPNKSSISSSVRNPTIFLATKCCYWVSKGFIYFAKSKHRDAGTLTFIVDWTRGPWIWDPQIIVSRACVQITFNETANIWSERRRFSSPFLGGYSSEVEMRYTLSEARQFWSFARINTLHVLSVCFGPPNGAADAIRIKEFWKKYVLRIGKDVRWTRWMRCAGLYSRN